jgi:hypothetical protein
MKKNHFCGKHDAARSGFPSPVKSPAAMIFAVHVNKGKGAENEIFPTVLTFCDIVLLKAATIISSLLSPLISAIVTLDGRMLTLKSWRVANEIVPGLLVFLKTE